MMKFAQRLDRIETSAIRELFKLLGKPGIISFAGGFPDAAMFDVEGIRKASQVALSEQAGEALQYGATEGHQSLREEIARHMSSKGVTDLKPTDLIITTGSQQALDLIGKTLLEDGDVALVESPTFLATIQCFRLYGPRVMGVPIDADGVRLDLLEEMIVRHRPKLIYIIPNFGNPSGVLLSLQRRLQLLQLVARHRVLLVEDDPYGELYFSTPPPPQSIGAQRPGAGQPGSSAVLWQLVQGTQPWVTHRLADRATRSIATRQHVQTIQRCPHLDFCPGDSRTLPQKWIPASQSRKSATSLFRTGQCHGGSPPTRIGRGFQFYPATRGLIHLGTTHRCRGARQRCTKIRTCGHHTSGGPGTPDTRFFADQADRSSLRLSFATSNTERIEEGVKRLGRALHDI